ncbi:acidic mammalian chitinase-like [Mixophyes fleayi]|uniref:acidic mammalian chitinase-like n=1 Tax=Mixophyes fleayi TaxID=3061075 RepID=UPI003F4E2DC3
MNYWKKKGAPAEKLLMGFPTYGRSLRNLNPNKCDVGIPVSGAGSAGPYTEEAGSWAYFEICTWLKGTTVKWITDQRVPIACKDNEWVAFDNKESYDCKVRFLKESGFGGAMVWTIDLDDFLGTFCNEGKYPLISHLKSLLEGSTINCPKICDDDDDGPTIPTTTPGGNPPVSPDTPVTPPPSTDEDPDFCESRADNYYVNPLNPNKFYRCVSGRTYAMKCGDDLVFDTGCTCCNRP